MVFGIARRAASESIAEVAALATALFPPIPYFGALAMTEVWTTFLLTASMWFLVRAWDHGALGTFVGAGILLALTALSRPAFALFPIFVVGLGLGLSWAATSGARLETPRWVAMFAAFAICMLPWFTYNYLMTGRMTLSPAGGFGRGLWEGSWQAMWPGRMQAELTHLAETIEQPDQLHRHVFAVAEREHLPVGPMLQYVDQWSVLHRIWTEPTGPYQRAMARITADDAYRRIGLENIAHQEPSGQISRLAQGLVILWAGEIPVRYSDINRLPAWAVRICWMIQGLIGAAALVGLIALSRVRFAYACLLFAPIVYITAAHLPFLKEARQSLPAQPMLLILAAAGAVSVRGQLRHSGPLSALEPQIHERQHL
jgi:hypothetical protein